MMTEVTPVPLDGCAAAVSPACFTGKEAFRQDPGNWFQHNFLVSKIS